MVVVSDGWVSNVTNYQQQISSNNNGGDEMVIASQEMCAKAVLICRPNSHPFQARTLRLDQPIKVGRSVARARAAYDNAIFDCKVLSRHHALLWYENGKFFLQDTKSSNGTFVNNTRLSSNESEPYELSSGDIVQFGVDVMENNRKVTHGCIIAMLKLFLPDGKEAKASPSTTEANGQGLVPLDEIYRLNQIIQEAIRREQFLETKLTTLEHTIQEAKSSADYTWQVRVDEERLLSRIAALENQLQQSGKNWTNEKLREEYAKLQDDKLTFQVATKEVLLKVHNEKLEALALVTEQERARATAEQEAQLAKDTLVETQSKLTELAQRLTEEQKRADEEKTKLEQQEKELQARLEAECQTITELKAKLEQLNSLHTNCCQSLFREIQPLEDIEKTSLIYNENLKSKEELLEDNENEMKSEPEQNHINLTVAPVTQETNTTETESPSVESEKLSVHVTFKLPESTKEDEPSVEDTEEPSDSEEKLDAEEKLFDSDHTDSKTLKYQYQSVQNELRNQIEQLETASVANKQRIASLEKELNDQKQITNEKIKLTEMLKQEMQILQQKLKESSNECKCLEDKLASLTEGNKEIDDSVPLSIQEIAALEEELVLVKEKYTQLIEEKANLNKQLKALQSQYNIVCNKSHNIMFFYIAPLILMVLYLFISTMTS